jgi:hypothetical protein
MSAGIEVLLVLSAVMMVAAGALTGSRGGWTVANASASAMGGILAVTLTAAAWYLS